MKLKISALTRHALNWAVSTIEVAKLRAAGEHVKEWVVEGYLTNPPPYSTDWLWGGPIIDRDFICVSDNRDCSDDPDAAWTAYLRGEGDGYFFGPTPLIAAMRCRVASKLGNEIDVPDELLS